MKQRSEPIRAAAERRRSRSAVPAPAAVAAPTPAEALQRVMAPAGSRLRPAEIYVLQQSQGNRAVQRLLASPARPAQIAGRTPAAMIQRFAPEGHLQATIRGLAGTYNAEEIALLVKSNWERDFSQGAAPVADVVLAWKAVKLLVSKKGEPSDSAAENFRQAVERLIQTPATEILNTSRGGYQYWEHMDNPGESAAKDADARWYGREKVREPLRKGGVPRFKIKKGPIPGYILDSRAYIKDWIVESVDIYRWQSWYWKEPRGDRPPIAVGAGINNWRSGDRDVERPEKAAGSRPGIEESAGPVAQEAFQQARQQGIPRGELNPNFIAAADPLARAMHAVEDFFAHSNWLELQYGLGGPKELITGTFDIPDKIHALGHKLTLVAEALLAEFELLCKVYDVDPEKAARKDKYRRIPIVEDSITFLGEAIDIILAADEIEERVKGGIIKIQDFLVSKRFLEALKRKGEKMMEHGARESPPTGHATIAKDAPEPGNALKTWKYNTAVYLAAQANRIIFGPLRDIMDISDVNKARAEVRKQLALVDQIIAPPSEHHWQLGLVPREHHQWLEQRGLLRE